MKLLNCTETLELAEALQAVLNNKPAEPAKPRGYTCYECGAPTKVWRELCPACKVLRRRDDRALRLTAARSSLPDGMQDIRIENLVTRVVPELFEAAMNWKMADGNLLLIGPTGSGKTTLSVAMMNRILDVAQNTQLRGEEYEALMEFAEEMRFFSAAELASARRNWPLGEGDPPVIEEAKRASLLVLDELGYETQTQDTAIPEIVDYRYSARGKLTIATSGRPVEELNRRYGEATPRKLLSGGRAVSLFPAPSPQPAQERAVEAETTQGSSWNPKALPGGVPANQQGGVRKTP